MVGQAPVICVMAPPIHLGAWSMAGCNFTAEVSFSLYLKLCLLHGLCTVRNSDEEFPDVTVH